MSAPTLQQIAEWLEKLGMSEYAQRFAEDRIDFSVLQRGIARPREVYSIVNLHLHGLA